MKKPLFVVYATDPYILHSEKTPIRYILAEGDVSKGLRKALGTLPGVSEREIEQQCQEYVDEDRWKGRKDTMSLMQYSEHSRVLFVELEEILHEVW